MICRILFALVLVGACAGDEPARPTAGATQPEGVTTTVAVVAASADSAPAETPTTSSTVPVPERWDRLPDAPMSPGIGSAAVWTGAELVVAGGMPSGKVEEAAMSAAAAAYDPTATRWRALPPMPGPGRSLHEAVWTGTEVVVWGGRRPGRYDSDGAAYNPVTGRWRTIARSPITGAENAMAVWTGEEMVVWGGNRHWEPTGDGAAYDPAADRWRKLPPAPIDARWAAANAWTGKEFVIWGGNGGRPDRTAPPEMDGTRTADRNDGAAYDPQTDRWRRVAPSPLSRRIATGVWTGDELLISGGSEQAMGGRRPLDGASYNPAADRWKPIPSPKAPVLLSQLAPVAWTGRELIVAGRHDGPHRWAAYQPDGAQWRALPSPPAPSTWGPTAQWTGSHLLAWGPVSNCWGDCTQTVTGQAGLRYTPPS